VASSARDPNRNLASLDSLDDFKVADGEPDPRGWEIIARDGRKIGEVDELIVDISAMKVRYLDCELDEDELHLEERDRHILIPVGHARLNSDDKLVMVDAISSDEVSRLPRFTGDLSQDYERGFGSVSDSGMAASSTGMSMGVGEQRGREVRLERVEEELAVGKTPKDTGEVRVGKHVETQHVTQPVTRQREEVDIERHRLEGRGAGESPQEEEIRIPLREEEIVTEKRPTTKEELVVRKRLVEEEETVEADLNEERFDIDQSSGRGRDDLSRPSGS
jgi:photosynthetic reaction center H subunit